MKIISIPHPTLRQVATPVVKVDKKLHLFIRELEKTLDSSRNPKGVGLAAPQVNTSLRIFATNMDDSDLEEKPTIASKRTMAYYINPEIIDHSDTRTFGPKKNEPILEGCLSIPRLYGPVPRWEWVKLRYQTVVGDELRTQEMAFQQYAARVIQHELDHLDGILFIDYIQEYELPLFQEHPKTKKLEELDPDFISALVANSKV